MFKICGLKTGVIFREVFVLKEYSLCAITVSLG